MLLTLPLHVMVIWLCFVFVFFIYLMPCCAVCFLHSARNKMSKPQVVDMSTRFLTKHIPGA